MERADVTIIGAGVVGLAIAEQLGNKGKETVVVERHKTFGQETSSRNSEVIHSGIYYPKGSLKARLCIEGKTLLYEFCEKYNIPHKRLGKLIVATDEKEAKELEKLIIRGRDNGVEDLRLLTAADVRRVEPHVYAVSAIYSPSTGIVDTHQLMKTLESKAKDKGVVFAYGCEVCGITRKRGGYELEIRDADGDRLTLSSGVVINSAGLHSDRLARMAGVDIEKSGYRLHYSKGEYFRVSSGKSKFVSKLIYPTPREESLGIHTVADLQGELKLGASAFYVDEINYDVDASHAAEFYNSVKKFLTFIEPDDLSPDISGIRPKLQAAGNEIKDFVISNEEDKGLANFINLIGIESPGLTSSLSIAKYIDNMV